MRKGGNRSPSVDAVKFFPVPPLMSDGLSEEPELQRELQCQVEMRKPRDS